MLEHNSYPTSEKEFGQWCIAKAMIMFPKFKAKIIPINKYIVYKQLNDFEKFKGSHILIVGGGPSTSEIDWEKYDCDFKWSCNHFYKKYKHIKFDLITIGNEVNSESSDLREYRAMHKPLVGYELVATQSRLNELGYINNILLPSAENYFFWYQTKFYSKLGFSARQIILASMLGADKVSFVGVDGKVGSNVPHAFENKKSVKPWQYNEKEMKTQYKLFWDYIHFEFNKTEFVNLGRNTKYNLLTEIQQENKNDR